MRFRDPFRASAVLVLVGLAAACGGDGGTEPPVATELRRTAGMNQPAGDPGTTLDPFEVQVRDQRGDPMPGVTLSVETTGGTLDATAPVTDDQGRAEATLTLPGTPGTVVVTFRGPGLAPVEFTADAQEIRADDECTTETPDTLALAAGEVVVREADGDAACFFVRAGAGQRYRIGLLRATTSEAPGDVAPATLHVSVGEEAAEPAAALRGRRETRRPGALRPAALDGPLLDAVRTARSTEAFHLRMLRTAEELARRLPRESLLPDRRGQLRPEAGRISALYETAAQAPDRLRLDVSTDRLCQEDDRRTHFLLRETANLALYQDSTQQADRPVDPASVAQVMDFFEAFGMDVIEEYFGGVSDINGDGKVTVIVTPVVGAGVAAFVWPGDFFEVSDCPISNERELVYFSADVLDAVANGNYQALATLVHEVKHVSSIYQRLRREFGTVENGVLHAVWVEEGTAEIAGEVASREAWAAAGGPARTAAVRAQDFDGGFTPESFGVALRLARTVDHLSSQPNSVVVNPVGSARHTIYGSGWHFHRWLGDAYGDAGSAPGADAALFREQNDSLSADGRRGIQEVTGRSFLELLEEWATAVLLNGNGHTPDRAIATYDFPSAAEIFCEPFNPVGLYPWPVTASGTPLSCEEDRDEDSEMAAPFETATFEGGVGPAGLRVHEFASDGSGPGAQFVVEGDFSLRVIVARIE